MKKINARLKKSPHQALVLLAGLPARQPVLCAQASLNYPAWLFNLRDYPLERGKNDESL